MTRLPAKPTISRMNEKRADWAKSTRSGTTLCVLEGHHVLQFPDKHIEAIGNGDIDWDGTPKAYHPDDKSGLDYLANAGKKGNWFGIVTDNGEPNGNPIIQGPKDPAPGFYVSSTAYTRKGFKLSDPRAYLDGTKIRFIVIEGYIRKRAKGIVLGCKAKITRMKTKKTAFAMVGDIGPLEKFGEISPALAIALGYEVKPRGAGIDNDLQYEIFPDTPGDQDGETFRLIRM